MARRTSASRRSSMPGSVWIASAVRIISALPAICLCAAGAMWVSFRICHHFGLFGQNLRLLMACGVFCFAVGLWCREFSGFSGRKTLGNVLALSGIALAAGAVILHLA